MGGTKRAQKGKVVGAGVGLGIDRWCAAAASTYKHSLRSHVRVALTSVPESPSVRLVVVALELQEVLLDLRQVRQV